jgi:hypothetical protein
MAFVVAQRIKQDAVVLFLYIQEKRASIHAVGYDECRDCGWHAQEGALCVLHCRGYQNVVVDGGFVTDELVTDSDARGSYDNVSNPDDRTNGRSQ